MGARESLPEKELKFRRLQGEDRFINIIHTNLRLGKTSKIALKLRRHSRRKYLEPD